MDGADGVRRAVREQVKYGGEGRFVILHFKQNRTLGVFDVQEGRFVLDVPLDDEDALYAAGRKYLAFALTAPLTEAVHASVFAWWPSELDYTEHLANPGYSRGLLVAAWTLGLAVTTIAVPVVEEAYFRGYLLPRLAHLGRWAPVVNTVLFALYQCGLPGRRRPASSPPCRCPTPPGAPAPAR